MRPRSVAIASASTTILALASTVPRPVQAQIPSGAGAPRTSRASALSVPLRTPDGQPDLQGTWNTATLTPLERPDAAKGRLTLTEAEATAIERAEQARVEQRGRPSDPSRVAPPVGGDGSTGAAGGVGGYNFFWIDRGDSAIVVDGQRRSSLVVDPVDGKIPQMTPEGTKRAADLRRAAPTSDAAESVETRERGAYDDVEQRPLAERCLIAFGSSSGPPALPVLYNNTKQIVQTKDVVMIFNEMVHDVRVIRMNQPHLPSSIRKWLGDSVGRWEGDTLVVDTTNFTDKTRFRGSSDRLHVVERFRRADAKTILYQFTVDDPATWPRPWTGEYPWVATGEQVFEYACHESNYSMQGILAGARLLEVEAAAKGRESSGRTTCFTNRRYRSLA